MKGLISSAVLLAAIGGLWAFPRVWYSRTETGQGSFWLAERQEAPGWTYRDVPVDASAERVLVADRLVSGELAGRAGEIVRVFSAKRYSEKPSEIGLFVHTPDRCWTENGWKIEPAVPDVVEVPVHGMTLRFERRVFVAGGARELVYFGGLVGGQPLPYRLDHNLGVGLKVALRNAKAVGGAKYRASDGLLWRRVWDAFLSRRRLLGPKQFIRVSTALQGDDVEKADALLRRTLAEWLQPVDYQKELAEWKVSRR